MINSLEIYDYQSHKETVLDFCSGVNTIIGKTDSGKSAVIRAIKLVTDNKPPGDSFISKWSDSCRVTIYKGNTHISRIKTKSKNEYSIFKTEKGEKEGKIEMYTGFGQDVPEAVKEVLNFDELNIQNQLDQPFLLSQSAGEVARYFNKIVNLEDIDTTKKNIDKTLKNETSRRDLIKEQLEEQEEGIEKVQWVVEAEKEFADIELKQGMETRTRNLLSDTGDLIYKYDQAQERLKEIANFDIKEAEAAMILLITDDGHLCKAEKEHIKLYNLIEKYDETCASLKTIADFNIIDAQEELEELNKRSLKLLEEKEMLRRLESIVESLSETKKKLARNMAAIKFEEKELIEIMPESCPLCGKEMCNESKTQ